MPIEPKQKPSDAIPGDMPPAPPYVPRYVRQEWKDPTCPKCGIVMGNKMGYCCREIYCPVGLN